MGYAEPNFRHMKKTDTKKSKEVAESREEMINPTLRNGTEKIAQAADQIFSKLKENFDTQKVDEWQKKWLAIPENRKKYQTISDAPEVIGEELLAISNDIIDFIQGEEGGKSTVLKKLKVGAGAFLKDSFSFIQKKLNTVNPPINEGVSEKKLKKPKSKKPQNSKLKIQNSKSDKPGKTSNKTADGR